MPSSTLHKISKATLEVHQNQIYAGWGHLTKKKGMLTGKSYGTTTSTVAFFAFARVVVGFSWVHRANSDSERTRIPTPIAALDTGPISKKKKKKLYGWKMNFPQPQERTNPISSTNCGLSFVHIHYCVELHLSMNCRTLRVKPVQLHACCPIRQINYGS